MKQWVMGVEDEAVGDESVGGEWVGVEENRDCLVEDVIDRLSSVASLLKLPHDTQKLFLCVSPGAINLENSIGLKIHGSLCGWSQYYAVLTFLMNGHLHAEYSRLSGIMGLPACSSKQWHRIVVRLEKFVTELAEWSCAQVREDIVRRGDGKNWVASFDGFYLTRGHYSNNSSSSVHDYATGKIAYFSHRTKRGKGHNWEGTSAGAETDMLDETGSCTAGWTCAAGGDRRQGLSSKLHILSPLSRGHCHLLRQPLCESPAQAFGDH